MSRPICIISSGISLDVVKKANPQMDVPAFEKKLNESLGRLDGIPGLYHTCFDVDPGQADEGAKSIASLKRTLRNGPPHGGIWDAFMIGGGLRMLPPFLGLFEEVVNLVSESSAGKTKFIFVNTGSDHYDLVKKAFPELNMA